MCRLTACLALSLLLSAVLFAAPTTTTIVSGPNPSNFGEFVTFTATVTSGGNPVTVGGLRIIDTYQGTTITLVQRPLNSSGQTTIIISSLGVGAHNLQAVYLGTSNFQGSESAILAQSVRAPTTTTVLSNKNPSGCTEAVTFTAAVTSTFAGTITGTVQFKDNGSPIAGPLNLVNGSAGVIMSSLSLGNHTITAEYSGNNNFGGSTGTLSQSVQDNTPPTITCPANIESIVGPGQCTAVVTYTPTASDNCSSVNVVSTPPSGTAFPVGITTVKCVATDAVDNKDSCSFTVTVRDTTRPVITCPSNVVRAADAGKCTAVVTYAPTASDNCSTVNVVSTPPSGTTFPVGTTTVTCRATDASGNTATCFLTVRITDTQPPTITTSSNPIVLWPPNHEYVNIPLARCIVAVNDNCDGTIPVSNVRIVSVSSDEPAVAGIVIASDCKSVSLRAERQGTGNGRVYTINIRASDASGNIGTASCKVAVPHDNSPKASAVDDGIAQTLWSNCSNLSVGAGQTGDLGNLESQMTGSNELAFPLDFRLRDNYPNPFNPSTKIRFEVPALKFVSLKIFDVFGREVATLVDEMRAPGTHEVTWDASALASGMYFYRLSAGAFVQTKKMMLIK